MPNYMVKYIQLNNLLTKFCIKKPQSNTHLTNTSLYNLLIWTLIEIIKCDNMGVF